MYLAVKDNAVCRIPESLATYYKELGYTLTDLDTPKTAEPEKTIPQKREEGKKSKE